MKRYRLTAAADQQLQEIWRYSQKRWNAAQVDAYLGRIEAAIEKALHAPTLLRSRPELGDGVLARKAGSHVAYGIAQGDTFVVIAVLHMRMDPRRHLLPKDAS